VPLRVLAAFAVLALAFLASVAWAFVREARSEWRTTNRRFEAVARALGVGPAGDGEGGIRQIWLPRLGRVDRCTTCHRGIDDPAFTSAPQPFAAHSGSWLASHPPDRFGCTVCHGGQGEATTVIDAGHRPVPPATASMLHAPIIEGACGRCHRDRHPAGAPSLAAGRDAIARLGCAGCHEIPGTDANEARAPRLDSIGFKTTRAWLTRYLRSPSALAGARMPDFRLTEAEIGPLVAFLLARRALTPLDTGSAEWTRADAERGRELFARARCVTCHAVDGRGGTIGPDLTTIASRASRAWMWSVITDPARDQPDTLMPRFGFAPAEVRDIVAYFERDLVDTELTPAGDAAAAFADEDVARGREIFVRRGCFGCHRLPGMESLPKIGPTLADIGDRAVDAEDFGRLDVVPTLSSYLYLRLHEPQALLPTALMPTYAMSDEQRLSIVSALVSLSRRPTLPASSPATPPPAVGPQGEFGAVVTRYRCLSCHRLEGAGSDLSTVPLDRIGSQLQPEYLQAFLLNPAAVRVSLDARMPRLHMTPADAAIVVRHARSVLVDDRLAEPAAFSAGERRRGEELYRAFGCAGCHGIGGDGGYVGPDLTAAGTRLRPGWVIEWLRAPAAWKPGTLQPDYRLSHADARALAAFVMTRGGTRR